MGTRLLPVAAFLLASACAAPAPKAVAEPAVRSLDRGTLAGSWREVRRDGRPVRTGYALSIGSWSPHTFMADKGCSGVAGVLRNARDRRFRIERYSGIGKDGCQTLMAGPAIAPFDGADVALERRGLRLLASGGGKQVELERITLIDLVVDSDHLLGTWRLGDRRGRILAGRDRGTLSISSNFEIRGSCAFYQTNSMASLPGLIINPGGSYAMQNSGACRDEGIGDRLTRAIGTAELRYVPDSDRIEARLPDGGRYYFVRARGS